MGLRRTLAEGVARVVLGAPRLRRALLLALSGQGVLFFRDTGDHVMLYHPHDVVGDSITRTGAYGRSAVRDLAGVLEREGRGLVGKAVLEVGANIGTHTVYFFRDLGCARVIALEPDPVNFEILKRNIRLNGLDDVVEPLQLAASKAPGRLSFLRDELNPGGSHLGGGAGGFMVEVSTVDTLLGEREAGIGLIWIDAEGHELDVLEGALETLRGPCPPVLLEYTPTPDRVRADRLKAILFETCGRVWVMGGGARALTPEGFDAIDGQVDLLAMR